MAISEKYKNRSAEKHPAWKGEDAKYWAKHGFIRNHFGKADRCEMSDSTCKGRFEWSNKDHKYSRQISDWQKLCSSHHKRYDYKKFNIVPWNKGTSPELFCSWCGDIFAMDKPTSRFCSKSCAMHFRNI